VGHNSNGATLQDPCIVKLLPQVKKDSNIQTTLSAPQYQPAQAVLLTLTLPEGSPALLPAAASCLNSMLSIS
jgi:hypothetical protein